MSLMGSSRCQCEEPQAALQGARNAKSPALAGLRREIAEKLFAYSVLASAPAVSAAAAAASASLAASSLASASAAATFSASRASLADWAAVRSVSWILRVRELVDSKIRAD